MCDYFQYFWRVLNNWKKEYGSRPYINTESIKKQSEQKQRERHNKAVNNSFIFLEISKHCVN